MESLPLLANVNTHSINCNDGTVLVRRVVNILYRAIGTIHNWVVEEIICHNASDRF